MKCRIIIPFLFIAFFSLPNQAQSEQKKKTDLANSFPRHMEEFSWQEAWLPSASVDISYNSSGSPVSIERSDSEGLSKQTFYYNNLGQETEIVSQMFVDGQWVNFEKETSSYLDESNPQSFMSYEWTGSDWLLTDGSKYDYTFDGNRISTMTLSSYSPEASWEFVGRYTYEYQVGSSDLVAIVSEVYEEGIWIYTTRTVYEYDGNQISAFFLYSWINAEWELVSKMIYEYVANESMVLTGSSWLDDAWMPSIRMTDNYDSHGNTILSTTEYYGNGWMVLSGQQYELTYSGSNVVQRITKAWSLFNPGQKAVTSIGWKNSKKEVFSDFASLFVPEQPQVVASVKVFPNPAQDQIQIIVQGESSTVSSLNFMDLTGRIRFKQDFLTPRSGVISQALPSSLSTGIYILQVSGSNGAPLAKKLITIIR